MSSNYECNGCSREDPQGRHYEDCPYLVPGDIVLDRETEEVVGEVNREFEIERIN